VQGPEGPPADERLFSRALETTVRIGLVLLLAVWCLAILRPFVLPVAWAVIIAVAVHPVYTRVREALGGRARLAAVLLTLFGLVLLIGPALLLADTLVEGAQALAAGFRQGDFALPRPPERVRAWPLVGEPLYAFWSEAASNIATVLRRLEPQLVALGRWLLASAAGVGVAVLQSLLSLAVAGVLLANDRGGARAAQSVARRLVGARGAEFAGLAVATVRSVTLGIVGVALIQATLAGLGFLAVGVPGAGLWALVALFCAVIQIGLLPVTLPLVVYVFYTAPPAPALAFAVWAVLVSLIDNVLKPLLLGRGVKVPMLVIFLGSIGGFLSSGIIGLFVGSVVLVLGYTLFQAWLGAAAPGPAEQADA
jgi:predicted PurR-regulated permease PerM